MRCSDPLHKNNLLEYSDWNKFVTYRYKNKSINKYINDIFRVLSINGIISFTVHYIFSIFINIFFYLFRQFAFKTHSQHERSNCLFGIVERDYRPVKNH